MSYNDCRKLFVSILIFLDSVLFCSLKTHFPQPLPFLLFELMLNSGVKDLHLHMISFISSTCFLIVQSNALLQLALKHLELIYK